MYIDLVNVCLESKINGCPHECLEHLCMCPVGNFGEVCETSRDMFVRCSNDEYRDEFDPEGVPFVRGTD